MDGIGSPREFLYVDGVVPDVPDLWVGLLLEDVDDVSRLDLGLDLALLLLGAPQSLGLTYVCCTPGKDTRRMNDATRIIIDN